LFVNDERQAEAADLLMAKINISRQDEVTTLWRNSSLIGWPGVIDDRCTVAWDFLVELYSCHQWLSKFFVGGREFLLGIRAYKALASFLEYTTILEANGSVADQRYHFSVPAVFLGPEADRGSEPHIESIVSGALPTSAMIERLCAMFGVPPRSFRLEWPLWYQQWMENYSALYHSLPPMIRRKEHMTQPKLPG
jgi:hypothetical protein